MSWKSFPRTLESRGLSFVIGRKNLVPILQPYHAPRLVSMHTSTLTERSRHGSIVSQEGPSLSNHWCRDEDAAVPAFSVYKVLSMTWRCRSVLLLVYAANYIIIEDIGRVFVSKRVTNAKTFKEGSWTQVIAARKVMLVSLNITTAPQSLNE
jgi:hypothetical protein